MRYIARTTVDTDGRTLIEWAGGNLRISTLSKVAAALGARLEVDLTSVA